MHDVKLVIRNVGNAFIVVKLADLPLKEQLIRVGSLEFVVTHVVHTPEPAVYTTDRVRPKTVATLFVFLQSEISRNLAAAMDRPLESLLVRPLDSLLVTNAIAADRERGANLDSVCSSPHANCAADEATPIDRKSSPAFSAAPPNVSCPDAAQPSLLRLSVLRLAVACMQEIALELESIKVEIAAREAS